MRIIPKKETLTIEFKSDIECLDETRDDQRFMIMNIT